MKEYSFYLLEFQKKNYKKIILNNKMNKIIPESFTTFLKAILVA